MKHKVTALKPVPVETHSTQIKPASAPQLPEIGYLRLGQIIGDKDNPPILPIGKTSFYALIKAGKVPKPTKLGKRTSAWRVEDIIAVVEAMGAV